MKRDHEIKTEERQDLTSKIEELNLHNGTSQHELKKLIKSKQVIASQTKKNQLET